MLWISQIRWLVMAAHNPNLSSYSSIPYMLPSKRSPTLRQRHIFTQAPKEDGKSWGVLWNSILLTFCYLTIRRAVSLHRALIEASRYCKSTTAWSLPLVLWDKEGLRCIWLGEAQKHLYLLRVFKKAVLCVCSLLEWSSLPALFSDIKPYFDVFFSNCFPNLFDCQNYLKSSDFYDQASLGNNLSLIH